jgi:hypothetical protein
MGNLSVCYSKTKSGRSALCAAQTAENGAAFRFVLLRFSALAGRRCVSNTGGVAVCFVNLLLVFQEKCFLTGRELYVQKFFHVLCKGERLRRNTKAIMFNFMA